MGGRLRWLTQPRSRVSLSSSLVISVCLVVVGRSVDEVVCSVVFAGMKTSFWFVCFLSQFGSSIYTLLRGSSSLRFLPACGLCLGYTCLIFLAVRTWLSLSLIQHRCRNKVVMCGEQLKVIVERKLVVKVRLKKGTVMDVCFIMDCYRGFVKVVRGHRERVVQMRVPAPYEEVFCLVCLLAYFIARSASHMIVSLCFHISYRRVDEFSLRLSFRGYPSVPPAFVFQPCSVLTKGPQVLFWAPASADAAARVAAAASAKAPASTWAS
ncbi:hypothetical protein DY000_02055735 [Brassica cretica]|uniref:Uncharacterized protein n=1 Tax=Brassica cretica TaxID=69181 RepID=A0ABQ7AIP0_BRACR|nr:hypothetical protein DY000_02055735 [Brassica cretica]